MATASAGFPQFDSRTEKWCSWICRLDNHLILQGKTDAKDKKHAVLAYMGAEAFRQLFDKVSPEKTPAALTYSEIISTVATLVEPKVNKWAARMDFRKMRQMTGEPLQQFEGRLRAACAGCSWEATEIQANLIEQFIAGVLEKPVQQALILKCDESKTLSDVFKIADAVATAQAATSGFRSDKSVNHLWQKQKGRGKFPKPPPGSGKPRKEQPKRERRCFRCGDAQHLAPDCRFAKVKCSACGTVGHLAKVCNKTSGQHHVAEESLNLEEQPFHFINRQVRASSRDVITVGVCINGHPVTMELDTGSGVSTMPLSQFLKLSPSAEFCESDLRLRTATGEYIVPHSYSFVNVSYADQLKSLKLYLIDQDDFPVLFGRSWLRSIALNWQNITSCHSMPSNSVAPSSNPDYKKEAQALLQKYPCVAADGIGRIPSKEAVFHFHSTPEPVYHRPRPVAEAILPLVDKELDLLEKNGVIERIDVSDWAHPIVMVPRANGKKVRICGDFKVGLNKFLRVDDYPLKNIRHALDNIGIGCKYSKLDISAAFLHMPVREEDQKFLVVNTHRGLYRFTRLSNGLSNASAVWQRYICILRESW